MSAIVESGIWSRILQSLKARLTQESFETWFRPIHFESLDHGARRIHLKAPNEIVRDWVSTNYSGILAEALSEAYLASYLVDWTVDQVDQSAPDPQNRAARVAAASGVHQGSEVFTLPPKANTAGPDSAVGFAPCQDEFPEPSLNPKYTYHSFVVGSCNQFAHAASLAVAEAPGKTYNPLYIYGGVGLGKTHLMHACGHAIKQRNRHLKLCYISSEKFMNELINAIRYDRTQGFREKYRSVDILLIDDVQFMAGKERTQEEFFHTFNSLYEQQKQIVISSDCPPREIPTLEERLHSRFEWGLIADIEPPDLETKVAILKRKAEILGVNVPDDVAFFIASRVKNNVRELEGSLIRLVAISSLRGSQISTTLAQDAIRNIAVVEEEELVTIQQIQNSVAANYGMTVAELVCKSNARRVSLPRQVAMYLCKRLTKHSYPEIGRAFGGKHHTTVMHSVEKIESLVSRDASMRKLTTEIEVSLRKR